MIVKLLQLLMDERDDVLEDLRHDRFRVHRVSIQVVQQSL